MRPILCASIPGGSVSCPSSACKGVDPEKKLEPRVGRYVADLHKSCALLGCVCTYLLGGVVCDTRILPRRHTRTSVHDTLTCAYVSPCLYTPFLKPLDFYPPSHVSRPGVNFPKNYRVVMCMCVHCAGVLAEPRSLPLIRHIASPISPCP